MLAGDCPVMSTPSNKHATSLGSIASGQHVENVVLPAPFGPDDSRQLTGVDRKRHIVEHDLLAETLVQAACFEERHPLLALALPKSIAQLLSHSGDTLGLNSTTAMNSIPYHRSQVSVYAPSRSRATMKNTAPITGPQKLTSPPDEAIITT